MRFGTRHFVCDTCGHYRNSMYPVTRCRNCGSTTLWEFPKVIAALEHGAHVKERRRNGEEMQAAKGKGSFSVGS